MLKKWSSFVLLAFTMPWVAHGASGPYYLVPVSPYWVVRSSNSNETIDFSQEEIARDWAEALNEAHEQRLAREEAKKNSDEHLSEGAKKRGCIFDGCNTCCPIKGVNAMDCTAIYCGPIYMKGLTPDPKSQLLGTINADDDVDWQ